ncbi:hypothetical protein DICPUDRAFT_149992 [Dictyostelium purpureum]|uniref:Uncharacterized protein n=1 Tax=Dictyostelium purpureum TaxID=5786 RepID=F0ZF64_DICPU|nr:uncharacterized protein DICPUDRAFT_149992 [Dictyostelium purpureum]EGC37419.1 hypothetical protein DICPUDRAFT_149992 [Dictyostelium purpureum]|eukprot:XP_003286072.1 hypothetical protein DICPUDRAFT_149992 [Dictyostelium purpureum]
MDTSSNYSEDQDLAPNDITFGTIPFSLNFHPTEDLLVVSDAEGRVKLYHYNLEENEIKFSLRPHKSGCRQANFSSDGKYIFTASSDCSMKVIDINTGSILYTREEAHDKDFMVFTGDDEGTIKVWDMRQQNIVCEFQEHGDFISDITTIGDKHIVASSGDGGVSIYNFVRKSMDDISEKSDNELLSVISLCDDEKLVCGSQDGTILIYDRNNLESQKKFIGHPQSVDSMVKVNNNSFFSGSSDGIIRYVGLQPKKLLGVVGEHSTFPIERMAISRDNRYLGSISHDFSLKFWNVSSFYEEDDGEQEDGENAGETNVFYSEDEDEEIEGGDQDDDAMAEDDSDSDDDDDESEDEESSDEDIKRKNKKQPSNNPFKAQQQERQKQKEKEKRSFFSDL